jgi:hypothetical protein
MTFTIGQYYELRVKKMKFTVILTRDYHLLLFIYLNLYLFILAYSFFPETVDVVSCS